MEYKALTPSTQTGISDLPSKPQATMPKLNEAPASEGDRLGPEGGTKSEETAMSGEEPAQSNDMYKYVK
jgi:hypothetical protein